MIKGRKGRKKELSVKNLLELQNFNGKRLNEIVGQLNKGCAVSFLLLIPFPVVYGKLELITEARRDVSLAEMPNSVKSINSKWPWPPVCLGIEDLFIALFLILLILMTVLGNILVVLSVFLYKRMRTFTNFLLTSLATADLLVGLLVMPLSLIDLLHDHNWPFGRFLCQIWATSDIFLCTASILNLCIISLDRYMAITSPLKYPRTRSRPMACGLLCLVWGISMIVCSPPWFIPEWDLFFHQPAEDIVYVCAYSPSVPYRIYSALVSFYIPLMVMLSVYFKIFRVASERERLMRQSLGTCRLSRRVEKTQRKGFKNSSLSSSMNQNRCALIIGARGTQIQSQLSNNSKFYNNTNDKLWHYKQNFTTHLENHKKISNNLIHNRPPLCYLERDNASDALFNEFRDGSLPPSETVSPKCLVRMKRESKSLINLNDEKYNKCENDTAKRLKVDELHSFPVSSRDLWTKSSQNSSHHLKQTPSHRSAISTSQIGNSWHASNSLILRSTQPSTNNNHQHHQSLQNPVNLLAKAQQHYQTNGPGKILRGSKEKIVYLRERKALKTIGIVVLGFIICWMPFFVVYLVEVFLNNLSASYSFKLLNEFFLWLGYSNSVLNPLIYTMYNGDFRRCFRDLLGFGCMQQHRRTMSVKKLHQQSTLF